ncbi:mitochondrial splicing system protein [Thelotrema lepadinum]|nr:mitochondrial splicing system protein [Thelotrema lepadinum]
MQCIRESSSRYLLLKEAVCGLLAGRCQVGYPKLTPQRVYCGSARLPHQCYSGGSSRDYTVRYASTLDCKGSGLASSASPTIYALSTASGRSAIAIVRCSGSLCLQIYKALCPGKALPKPRYASVRTLVAPTWGAGGGAILDPEALVLYFPAPRTVTGEDVIEFHVHGGNAIVKALLAAIPTSVTQPKGKDPVVRYAEPGEFTRRAFYSGRLDLTQVEALGDTLSAETEKQRSLAVRGLNSALHERYEAWTRLLLAARGELEALIDFSEDQHFDDSPAEFVNSVSLQIVDLRSRISSSLRNAARGELLRNGVRIALLGAPNAGKSSLLNQIVGREAAIVSAEAGTTRDVVEVNVDIGGFFCKFNDLAGVRADSDSNMTNTSIIGEIEKEGIRRAKASTLSADIVIVVTPIEKAKDRHSATLDPSIAEFLRGQIQPRQKVIHVLNKMDMLERAQPPHLKSVMQGFTEIDLNDKPVFPISCLLARTDSAADKSDESGLQAFLNGLTQEIRAMTNAEAVDPLGFHKLPESLAESHEFDESLGSTERQRRLLEQCNDNLTQFLQDIHAAPSATSEYGNGPSDIAGEIDIVLAAERLRTAAECLAKITGRGEGGDVEEVLGVVFEKFCVGK